MSILASDGRNNEANTQNLPNKFSISMKNSLCNVTLSMEFRQRASGCYILSMLLYANEHQSYGH